MSWSTSRLIKRLIVWLSRRDWFVCFNTDNTSNHLSLWSLHTLRRSAVTADIWQPGVCVCLCVCVGVCVCVCVCSGKRLTSATNLWWLQGQMKVFVLPQIEVASKHNYSRSEVWIMTKDTPTVWKHNAEPGSVLQIRVRLQAPLWIMSLLHNMLGCVEFNWILFYLSTKSQQMSAEGTSKI